MKRILFLVVAGLTFASAPAFAQDAETEESGEPESRFYDFGDMVIDGELLRPEGVLMNERGQRQFESLLSLRRSFIQEIENATDESALE